MLGPLWEILGDGKKVGAERLVLGVGSAQGRKKRGGRKKWSQVITLSN